MTRWLWIALAALGMLPGRAGAQYIGIFMDAEATRCAGEVGPMAWLDLHVVAVLEGDVTELTGAQFRITGVPAEWTDKTAIWVPATGAINIGHPVFPIPNRPDRPGVNVAFSNCQRGRVELGRLILLGAPTPENVVLRVEIFKLFPDEPDCVLTFACDFPAFSRACVGGGQIVLNGPGAGCQVAVDADTWTGVKLLYRD